MTRNLQVVDGSNESLRHADDEMHPLVRNFSLSQTIFKNIGVDHYESHPSVALPWPAPRTFP